MGATLKSLLPGPAEPLVSVACGIVQIVALPCVPFWQNVSAAAHVSLAAFKTCLAFAFETAVTPEHPP